MCCSSVRLKRWAPLKALRDPHRAVRRKAAEVLSGIGDSRAVVALVGALEDSCRDVRRLAALALKQLGSSQAVEPLVEALHDSDQLVREAAAGTLGEIGDERAVLPLIQALAPVRSRTRFFWERAPRARGKQKTAYEMLRSLVGSGDVYKRQAIKTHAHVFLLWHYSQSVSYTHLTLPTNREV